MAKWHALAAGGAGALTVTLLNEVVRRFYPHAPRMEVLGMRAIARSLRGMDQEPPERDELFGLAMVGDLISNTLYYSLTGIGSRQRTWLRGAVLGLVAGLGGAILPRPMGLGRQPGERFPITHLLTIAWYFIAGLASAAAFRRLSRSLD